MEPRNSPRGRRSALRDQADLLGRSGDGPGVLLRPRPPVGGAGGTAQLSARRPHSRRSPRPAERVRSPRTQDAPRVQCDTLALRGADPAANRTRESRGDAPSLGQTDATPDGQANAAPDSPPDVAQHLQMPRGRHVQLQHRVHMQHDLHLRPRVPGSSTPPPRPHGEDNGRGDRAVHGGARDGVPAMGCRHGPTGSRRADRLDDPWDRRRGTSRPDAMAEHRCMRRPTRRQRSGRSSDVRADAGAASCVAGCAPGPWPSAPRPGEDGRRRGDALATARTVSQSEICLTTDLEADRYGLADGAPVTSGSW